MGYLEKLAKKAKRHRKDYYKKFRDEVMEDLEGMAASGEYNLSINVSAYPPDVLTMIGDELHDEGFKYSVHTNDKEDVTLFVSLRHAIPDNA
jgi:hypothetical protein